MNTLMTRNDWRKAYGNRRRPFHQRLLWRLSRHIPLDGVTLNSPLIIQGILSLMGAFAALLVGFHLVALVLATSALGCLACQLRRHSGPATSTHTPAIRIHISHPLHQRHYRLR